VLDAAKARGFIDRNQVNPARPATPRRIALLSRCRIRAPPPPSPAAREGSRRPRRREAVSGARVHNGLRTESTASVSIASTGVFLIGSQ
jgi:hypothetical protein